MSQYEMMYVLHPQLSDEDIAATIEQVSRYVITLGGEVSQVIRDAPWGRRRLNYTLHHNGQVLRDGFYVLSYFGLDDPRLLVELERAMNLDDRVVRYLIVKTEAKNVAGGGFREDDPDLIPGVPGQRINQKAAS